MKKNNTIISKAIRQVVQEINLRPFDINDGLCEEFAAQIKIKVPQAHSMDLGINYGHICVKYMGKYYDAEEPEGVKHWKQLPLCIRRRRK